MAEIKDTYKFPGGVCPACEYSPLQVKVFLSDSGWSRAEYVCPNCGHSEGLAKTNPAQPMQRELSNWSRDVTGRDKRCVICGETQGLDAHHILPKSKYPTLQTKLGNGITLCRRCHRLVHESYVPWPEKYK